MCGKIEHLLSNNSRRNSSFAIFMNSKQKVSFKRTYWSNLREKGSLEMPSKGFPLLDIHLSGTPSQNSLENLDNFA